MPKKVDIVAVLDEDGRIKDPNRRDWLRGQFLLFGGGKVRIQLSKPKRSSRANKYYWKGVIGTIWQACLEAGIQTTTGALHEEFKEKYLPARPVVGISGQDRTLPPSTADLDSTEFFEYVENVRTDENVMALGVYILSPQEWEQDNGKIRSGSITEP